MKKRLLSLLLCTAMVATALVGCGGGSKETKAAETKAEETKAGETTVAAEDVTIKVAAIETAYGSEMWQKVCEAFTEQTGIKVELTTDKKLEDVLDLPCRAEIIRMLFTWQQAVKPL